MDDMGTAITATTYAQNDSQDQILTPQVPTLMLWQDLRML
jgi:hypothetical protein